jgi:hypothetical protein
MGVDIVGHRRMLLDAIAPAHFSASRANIPRTARSGVKSQSCFRTWWGSRHARPEERQTSETRDPRDRETRDPNARPETPGSETPT